MCRTTYILRRYLTAVEYLLDLLCSQANGGGVFWSCTTHYCL